MSRFIELFAGCGGMSLGLQSLGFELALANELSPMAAETFAFNHLGVDVSAPEAIKSDAVLWLTSNFARSEMRQRLSENPHDFPDWDPQVESDVPAGGFTGKNQLAVGSVITLNKLLEADFEENSDHRERLAVELVSGGPPCQSFSMAGLRQRDNHRNQLPWEFAKFVNLVRPKTVLLENVSGILRPFIEDGIEFHAWKEVAKAFVEIGYAPLCVHVNAKYVGVAQNRPRFIMFAIRGDLAAFLADASLPKGFQAIARQALMALRKSIDWDVFRYWDAANSLDESTFAEGPLRHLRTRPAPEEWATAGDAIQDLAENSSAEMSEYVVKLGELFPRPDEDIATGNLQKRKHTFRVQQRFRLYQVLEALNERKLSRTIARGMREGDLKRVEGLVAPLMNQTFLFDEGQPLRSPGDPGEIISLIQGLTTKKHSQRALVARKPAPAALSIPDDCCHYSARELRTLSVREMARIQSFPDWFEFRSKPTTGGNRRKFEVPQYTQVGNAVPPVLARQAGLVVQELLELAEAGSPTFETSDHELVQSAGAPLG